MFVTIKRDKAGSSSRPTSARYSSNTASMPSSPKKPQPLPRKRLRSAPKPVPRPRNSSNSSVVQAVPVVLRQHSKENRPVSAIR
jgi:hypothetical protein